MALTVDELARSMRLLADDADELVSPELEIVTRLAAVSDAFIELLIPNAPEAIQDEAKVRFASYLYEAPQGGRGDFYGNAWRNSGAAGLASRWIIRRASETADAVPAGVPLAGGLNTTQVMQLIAQQISEHTGVATAHHAPPVVDQHGAITLPPWATGDGPRIPLASLAQGTPEVGATVAVGSEAGELVLQFAHLAGRFIGVYDDLPADNVGQDGAHVIINATPPEIAQKSNGTWGVIYTWPAGGNVNTASVLAALETADGAGPGKVMTLDGLGENPSWVQPQGGVTIQQVNALIAGQVHRSVEEFQDTAAAMWESEPTVAYDDVTGMLDIEYPAAANPLHSFAILRRYTNPAPGGVGLYRIGTFRADGSDAAPVTVGAWLTTNGWELTGTPINFAGRLGNIPDGQEYGFGYTEYSDLGDIPIIHGRTGVTPATAANAGALLLDQDVVRLYRNVLHPGHGATATWRDFTSLDLRSIHGADESTLTFLGVRNLYQDLPTSGQQAGDVYYLLHDDTFREWNSNTWRVVDVNNHLHGQFVSEAHALQALADRVGSGTGTNFYAAFDEQGTRRRQATMHTSSSYTAPTSDTREWIDYLSGVIAALQGLDAVDISHEERLDALEGATNGAGPQFRGAVAAQTDYNVGDIVYNDGTARFFYICGFAHTNASASVLNGGPTSSVVAGRGFAFSASRPWGYLGT